MKKKILLNGCALLCASLLITGCGGGQQDEDKKPNPDDTQEVEKELIDNREKAFTVVSGSMVNGEFEPDGDEVDFASLYEAANYVYDNCDNGSFVKKKGDETNTVLFQRRAGQDSIDGAINDQWFYYRDGSMLDGYSQYIVNYYNNYGGEDVTYLMASSNSMKYTYQPYGLISNDDRTTTASWNLLPLLDTSVRYNPKAFVGIRSETVSIKLSEAKIRPSYNEIQKAMPLITLSSTDSYNWSNQGIWMDTDTGNWYLLQGETQSDVKSLEYDISDQVILTSSWDQEKQEFTPNGDITMTLEYRLDEEFETWVNDFTITVTSKDGTTKTFENTYEYLSMNGRGTPRVNFSLDLVSNDEDYDEATFAPDFMCGAYFKNITVTEAKGTVPEGLTDDEYMGDTPMVGTPGETYSFMVKDMNDNNAADVEVILDHCDAITYHDDITENDVFDISYEQEINDKTRSDEVLNVEKLISEIPENATSSDVSVIKANAAYQKLTTPQLRLVRDLDGFKALEEALNRE